MNCVQECLGYINNTAHSLSRNDLNRPKTHSSRRDLDFGSRD